MEDVQGELEERIADVADVARLPDRIWHWEHDHVLPAHPGIHPNRAGWAGRGCHPRIDRLRHYQHFRRCTPELDRGSRCSSAAIFRGDVLAPHPATRPVPCVPLHRLDAHLPGDEGSRKPETC